MTRSERFWSFQKPGSALLASASPILLRRVAASKTPPDLEDIALQLSDGYG